MHTQAIICAPLMWPLTLSDMVCAFDLAVGIDAIVIATVTGLVAFGIAIATAGDTATATTKVAQD